MGVTREIPSNEAKKPTTVMNFPTGSPKWEKHVGRHGTNENTGAIHGKRTIFKAPLPDASNGRHNSAKKNIVRSDARQQKKKKAV